MADYHCKGDSARFSVVVCSVLVTIIIAMKMLPEERRCFGERLALIRYGSKFTYFDCVYRILFGDHKMKAFKILCYSIFHSFRIYGVVTMVYVAVMEQIMLFETILDYIINSVVVLLIAEVDELSFLCLNRVVLSNKVGKKHDLHPGDREESFSGALLLTDPMQSIQFSKIESDLHAGGHHESNAGHRAKEEEEEESSLNHMTELELSERERDALLIFDFWIVRCNALAMIIPLVRGKLTGRNCSEDSFIRVSEIGMVLLMGSRVILNVYVDVFLSRSYNRGAKKFLIHFISSLFQHAAPCVAYLFLMYLVFVDKLKK